MSLRIQCRRRMRKGIATAGEGRAHFQSGSRHTHTHTHTHWLHPCQRVCDFT
ncbi:hypothetical protein PILCRDRAFT_480917 [Piloderma croceum F 1598]|uniref:Uncharacterized protein n=1 Tax=Piloderma croceum (strain F 1598) TaxID=765440 RepID=A0A0C3BX31_PILCF|nr:hypothetical protein PILCRDRAFT_750995 [Piloderma croceum F 1598]KIM81987.1 hypothetical protein PILCRDRAFT_480917 [Piloderma croceum F 1598]